MEVFQAKGTPREVGRQYGEAYREGFRQFHADVERLAAQHSHWYGQLGQLRATIEGYLPRFWEELVGTAEGAGMALAKLLLNHRYTMSAEEGCTNISFFGAPGGPIFGKNLDLGLNPTWTFVVRHVQYENGQEVIHTTYLGDIMGRDTCMNGHGLTVGGSSVGSVFQKSLSHVPIDDLIYEMIASCATVEEGIRFVQRYPTFGKGYNFVLADAKGQGVVLECACPLTQVRRPEPGRDVIFCTNTYKLPALLHADRRTPQGKAHSEQRFHYLERKLYEERVPRTVEQIQTLLAAHGPDGGLCNPAFEGDELKTRLSVVTLPAERAFYLADGRPCDAPFLPMVSL